MILIVLTDKNTFFFIETLSNNLKSTYARVIAVTGRLYDTD
jgi:hypothetical protein